jgi:hypothetical protein
MEEAPRTHRTGLAAGIIGAVVALAVVAFILNLGPFADGDLTAAEFAEQGDELCAQAHDEFLDIQSSTPRTPAEAEAQVEALIEVATQERESLADLEAPASVKGDLDAYLEDREKGIELLRDGLEAARADNPAAYEAAQARLASQQMGRQAAAQRLGFSECSAPLVGKDELESQAQPPAED